MTTTLTTAAPMIPTPLRAADGSAVCWKRDQNEWATCLAPWGDDPGGWLWRQQKRLVYSSGCAIPDGFRPPLLQVYAVGGLEDGDPGSLLVGEFASMTGFPVNLWYFLCDRPALPRLVAEYEPMLRCDCGHRQARRIEAAGARLTALRKELLGSFAGYLSAGDQ